MNFLQKHSIFFIIITCCTIFVNCNNDRDNINNSKSQEKLGQSNITETTKPSKSNKAKLISELNKNPKLKTKLFDALEKNPITLFISIKPRKSQKNQLQFLIDKFDISTVIKKRSFKTDPNFSEFREKVNKVLDPDQSSQMDDYFSTLESISTEEQ